MGTLKNCNDVVVVSDCVGIPGLPGAEGPQGPVGPSGAGALLTHDQLVAASVWIINHGFGRNCHVTLLISGEEVTADVVQALNTVTVTWPYPVAGRAFLS